MLESYEAYADYNDVMSMVEEMVAAIAREALGGTTVKFGEEEIELAPPWKRLPLREALIEYQARSRRPRRFARRTWRRFRRRAPALRSILPRRWQALRRGNAQQWTSPTPRRLRRPFIRLHRRRSFHAAALIHTAQFRIISIISARFRTRLALLTCSPNSDPCVMRVPQALRVYPILYQPQGEIRTSSGHARLAL
jgi:hypothetical protein